GVCQAPTCNDGVRNGTETDTDCGGTCPQDCAAGRACGNGADCISGVCTNNVCQAPTCVDAVRNGNEKGVDCGGGCPTGCAAGTACDLASDCASLVCNVTCQAPTCNDGVENGDETDVDCGGACGATCVEGEACVDNGDCATGLCTNGTCAALCANGILDAGNGETDVDCGGANCAPCGLGEACGNNDANCGAAAPQCVANACQVCDPADHAGCGANQLCCDGGGAPACQNATTNDCTACADGACDPLRANLCAGRTCLCGAEAACDPQSNTPKCIVDQNGASCGCEVDGDCESGNCLGNGTCGM
ncbi:MAG: hypothetical protein KC613_07265, partial [Myxococcales bacterium]|nr:hypothetical protein [Myxococcales bacterium]